MRWRFTVSGEATPSFGERATSCPPAPRLKQRPRQTEAESAACREVSTTIQVEPTMYRTILLRAPHTVGKFQFLHHFSPSNSSRDACLFRPAFSDLFPAPRTHRLSTNVLSTLRRKRKACHEKPIVIFGSSRQAKATILKYPLRKLRMGCDIQEEIPRWTLSTLIFFQTWVVEVRVSVWVEEVHSTI